MGVRAWLERQRAAELEPGIPMYTHPYVTPGFSAIVPTLQFTSQRGKQASQELRENPLLLGPVGRLAIRMGALPLKVYRIDTTTGERVEAPDHPAQALLRKPNPKMPRNLMIGGTVLNMLGRNRCGWWKRRDYSGAVRELWPIPGTILFPIKNASDMLDHYEIRLLGLTPVEIPYEDVVYFRLLPDIDDWANGMTPVQSLGQVSGFGGSALDAMADLFENGILQRQYFTTGGKELSPKARMRLEASLEAMRRGGRSAVPVIEEGEFKNMGDSVNQSLMTDAVSMAQHVVNSALNLPPLVDIRGIARPENVQIYYSEAVQPVADAIEQELELHLMTEWPKDPAFPEFGFREVLKGTPAQRIDMHRSAILSGQETLNEARKAENMPSLGPSGDVTFVPLNAVPTGGNPQGNLPKDSTGGQGGVEGKDTLAVLPQPAALTEAADGIQRWRAARKVTWRTQRSNIISRYSEAAVRRQRGALKKELRAIRDLTGGTGRVARAQAETGLPSLQELITLARTADPEIAQYLREFMQSTGDAAWAAAYDFLVVEDRRAVDQSLMQSYADRADAVAGRFGIYRQQALTRLLEGAIEQGTPIREFSQQVEQQYANLADYYVNGIARTETAYAYEQAAMTNWRSNGIGSLEFVFGGGPCTTGVCEEQDGQVYELGAGLANVGSSFADADAPPLHPACDCFTVPAVEGV